MSPSQEQDQIEQLPCWEVAQQRALAYTTERHRRDEPRDAAIVAWDREVLEQLRSRPRRQEGSVRSIDTPPMPQTPRAGHRRTSRGTTSATRRRRQQADDDSEPGPRRRETLRRRAMVVESRCIIERHALTVDRFRDLTPDLSGPERLITFLWLPSRHRSEFYGDVQRLANLDQLREGWQA